MKVRPEAYPGVKNKRKKNQKSQWRLKILSPGLQKDLTSKFAIFCKLGFILSLKREH
jgi:hypothetical protein